jgi:spore maturation protein CgeB
MWFVENYRHLTYWQQLAAGYDFWFVIQQESCISALKQAGAKDVRYLPMAADPSVHRPVDLTQAERDEYGSDVSFVGAGYANRREIFPRLLGHEWIFKLWGNEWDGATGLNAVLQRNGARIDTDTCQKIFNASAVNLNLHSWGGAGFDPDGDFVNPRTFELAACGAFQLTDRRSLMPPLFTESEVTTVSSPDDLPGEITFGSLRDAWLWRHRLAGACWPNIPILTVCASCCPGSVSPVRTVLGRFCEEPARRARSRQQPLMHFHRWPQRWERFPPLNGWS